MIEINNRVSLADNEIDITAVRSQGAGGQNVNKVASAVHLRFDIRASSLPDTVKDRLLRCRDRRITKAGVVVIKSQEHRTFEKNREAACLRLVQLIRSTMVPFRKRKATRPTRGAVRRRVDSKTKRGRLKQLRQKVARTFD